MRALYSTLANVRAAHPKKHAGLEFEWMRIVPARGEYRRYVGDYAMNENEVRDHVLFDDSIVYNDQAFFLHYGGNDKYDFRLKSWIWDMRGSQPYALPFRCLYSADVPNLLCAGKHISVTRVVGTNVKMMANGAQHGIAAGCAAALCAKQGWTPREVAAGHMPELRAAVSIYTDVPQAEKVG